MPSHCLRSHHRARGRIPPIHREAQHTASTMEDERRDPEGLRFLYKQLHKAGMQDLFDGEWTVYKKTNDWMVQHEKYTFGELKRSIKSAVSEARKYTQQGRDPSAPSSSQPAKPSPRGAAGHTHRSQPPPPAARPAAAAPGTQHKHKRKRSHAQRDARTGSTMDQDDAQRRPQPQQFDEVTEGLMQLHESHAKLEEQLRQSNEERATAQQQLCTDMEDKLRKWKEERESAEENLREELQKGWGAAASPTLLELLRLDTEEQLHTAKEERELAEKRVEALSKQHAALQQDHTALQQSHRESDKQLRALQSSHASLSDEHSRAQGRLQDLEDWIATIHTQLEDVYGAIKRDHQRLCVNEGQRVHNEAQRTQRFDGVMEECAKLKDEARDLHGALNLLGGSGLGSVGGGCFRGVVKVGGGGGLHTYLPTTTDQTPTTTTTIIAMQNMGRLEGIEKFLNARLEYMGAKLAELEHKVVQQQKPRGRA